MHPRNIYKNPPNFKELAICYPEFRKFVTQDLSGKVTINYQDQNAVKALTCTLLKKDFNLDVEISEARLIPRIPLCLNYILWVEDLLTTLKLNSQPFGIDIGTGCACIYSLLAAKKGWKMLATDIDPINLKSAEKNVEKNNFQNLISLKLVDSSDKLLIGVTDKQCMYEFCMCNPPFFDYNEQPQNRTLRRPQLNTKASEITSEISTKGGEMTFINKLLQESKELKDHIKIYTTLVGKKSDFIILKKEIKNICPKSVTYTRFCQGRTVRWGLAWSFLDINLKVLDSPAKKKVKSKPPLSVILASNKAEDMNRAFESIKQILNELKITFSEECLNVGFTISFKAYKDTWSHQRKKRRMEARLDLKQNKECESEKNDVCDSDEYMEIKKIKLDSEKIKEDCTLKEVMEEQNFKNNDTNESLSSKKTNLGLEELIKSHDSNDLVLIEGLILIKNKDNSIVMEICYISGNKECLHQIFQYIKNHYNTTGFSS